MSPEEKEKFSERMKQLTAVLAAAIMDRGGEIVVSAENLAAVRSKIDAGQPVGFQFSDDGRGVRLSR